MRQERVYWKMKEAERQLQMKCTIGLDYGEDLAERLGCREVAAKDIKLTPGLLKK